MQRDHGRDEELRSIERWRGYARGSRPVLTIGLLLLGATLLARHLQHVDWPAMRVALAQLPARSLIDAALLGALSYAVYCSYDLLARRTTGHALDRLRLLAIAFVAHACALSFGPPGAGIRLRLATRHGLPLHQAAALWLFNVATNWLGFTVLAGLAFATQRITWPPSFGIAPSAMRLLGLVLLGIAFAYVAACAWGAHLRWTVRGIAFRLPPAWVALAQCALSALNWLLLAAIIHALLRERVPLFDVLGAVMASALALALVDVPAGLGVTETVFLTLLGGQAPSAEILAALMAYRALYFLAPLLLASGVYLALEWDAHRRPRDTAGLAASDPISAPPQWRDERSLRTAPAAPARPAHRHPPTAPRWRP